MEDTRIVELYWQRSENAIAETAAKYERYCYTIACNILASPEDANECVNDTWLGAWNSIPPHRPAVLATYLGKITRRLSINRWKEHTRDKRGGGELPLALEELAECVPSPMDIQSNLEGKELAAAID